MIISLELARAFIKRIKTDEEFKKKIGEAKDKEERIKLVKESGFDFTRDDLELAKGEISEDDIKIISGGSCCGRTCENEDSAPPPPLVLYGFLKKTLKNL